MALKKILTGWDFCKCPSCEERNNEIYPTTSDDQVIIDELGSTLAAWLNIGMDGTYYTSLYSWLQANYPNSSYTLPVATDSILGGIKVGSGLTITNGVLKNPNVYTTTEDSGIIINESNEISVDSSMFPTVNNGLLTISDANNTSVNFTANSSVDASFTIPKATLTTYGTAKAIESTEGSSADVYPVKIGSSTTTYTNGTTISTGQLYFVAPPSSSNVYTAGDGISISNTNEISAVPRNPVYFIKDPIDDWNTSTTPASTKLFDFTTKLLDDMSWGLHPIIYLYVSDHGTFSNSAPLLGSHLQGFIKLLTTNISTSLPGYSSFPDNAKGILTLYVYTSCASESYTDSTITFDKNYCFLQGLSVGTLSTNAARIDNSYSHNNPSIAFSSRGYNARTWTDDEYTIVLDTTGQSVNKFDFLYLGDSGDITDSITGSHFNIRNLDVSKTTNDIKVHIFWSSYEKLSGGAYTNVHTDN